MNYRGISIYASFYFNRKPLTTDVGENLPNQTYSCSARGSCSRRGSSSMGRNGARWRGLRGDEQRGMLPLLPFPLIQPMINIGMLLSRFGLRPFGLVVWSCRLVLSFQLWQGIGLGWTSAAPVPSNTATARDSSRVWVCIAICSFPFR